MSQSTVEQANDLTRSLVYFVSPRGASNYWARLINGMSKVFSNEDGTLSVSLAPNYRYVLTCHLPFYEKCSPQMKLLVLVHEAGHVALNHIPRLFKMMGNTTDPFMRMAIRSVFNFAADFAVNDSIVRKEPGFKEVHRPKGTEVNEFTFLLPEEFGLPTGKSMEEYILLMLKDLPKFKQKVEDLIDALQQAAGGDPQDGDGEDGSGSGSPKPNRGGIPDSIPGIPDELLEKAMNNPEIFEMLEKAFEMASGHNHRPWNEKAEEMTPEEAVSAANKMKKHAQTLARSANEQTTRERGTMPGHMQKIIDMLLEPEQLPWDIFLKDIIQGQISARVREEMSTPNLSLINEDYLEPWPGQTLEFGYRITWLTDTSGSMGDDEYARACAALNGLLAINKNVKVTYVECDATLQKEVVVDNIEPPDQTYLDELRQRRGYGGTSYAPFFKRILGVDTTNDWMPGAPRLEDAHPMPDLIVVCTDGGVRLNDECFPRFQPPCPIIWLLMPGCYAPPGMDNVSPNRLVEMFRIREEN